MVLAIVQGELSFRAPGGDDLQPFGQIVFADNLQAAVADQVQRLSCLGFDDGAKKKNDRNGEVPDHLIKSTRRRIKSCLPDREADVNRSARGRRFSGLTFSRRSN